MRTHTIVLGRTAYLFAQIVVNQLVPRMLTPDAWNWGARAGLFWYAFGLSRITVTLTSARRFGTNVLSFIYTFFRLPESKGRTYEELDVLFFRKTPARAFKSTVVDGELAVLMASQH